MALLTDGEISEAIEKGEISIDPFDGDHSLQAASYDLHIGKNALITKSVKLEELKKQVEEEAIKDIDVEKERSIAIPGGALALVTTSERIRLDDAHAGHIGMSSYYVRKGLTLLSGLQIDPGWDGHLVLGLSNLSPRTVILDYGDRLCSIEIHRLAKSAERPYDGRYMEEQREGRIPRSDKDYLRTIETMSVSDLTHALIALSGSVESLGNQFRGFWLTVGLIGIAVLATFVVGIVSVIVD